MPPARHRAHGFCHQRSGVAGSLDARGKIGEARKNAGLVANFVQVTVALADGAVSMTMCNVVPESALSMAPPDGPPMSAGPYDVMVASWLREPAT